MGSSPFGPAAGGFGGSAGGFAPQSGSPNPYASPQAINYQQPIQTPAGPITNVPVSVEQVFNYAWQIWQVNLGLLVGTTVMLFAIIYGLAIPIGIAQAALENDSPEAAALVGGIGNIVSNLIQMYLGIGQAQIALKLARRQPANFSDLFSGGEKFLYVFVASLLAGVVVLVSLITIVGPIILALMFWPFYWLIVDGRAGIIESFSIGRMVADKNWGTVFVLALLNLGINLLGCMALCIGMLFSIPLGTMLFAVAYLMMSGQLSPYGQLAGQAMPGQFATQPMPGKW